MARSGSRTPLDSGRPAGGRSESTSLVATIVAWTRLTAIASLMATAVLAGLLAVSRAVYEPRLEQSVEATAAARRAHEAMLDQETGLRGFLASGDERFLEPFERGRRDLPGHNDEVARLLAGEGRPGALLLDMRLAQQAWVDGWADEAVAVGRSSGRSAPAEFLDEGRALFDRYRQSYDALVTSLVARRRAAVQASSNSLLAVVSVALMATGAFFVDSVRRGRVLRRAVGPPLAELLRRLDRIRAGDFGPQPPLHGPVELATIGSGIDSTAEALASARQAAEEQAAQLAARGQQLAEVLRLAREVAGSLSLRYVLRAVCGAAAGISDGARVVVWLRDEGADVLVAAADSHGPDLRPAGLQPVPIGGGVVGEAARFGRGQRIDGTGDARPGSTLTLPMVVGARVIGVVELTGPTVGSLAESTAEVLETLAIHAATAIEAARLHERTESMALTDVLTGLANRRRLDDDLAVEVSAAVRYSRPLAFVMIDADHFKSYNDEFGHQAGDVALQQLSGLLSQSLRGSDSVYRYGGEEFALLLRETPAADAAHLGERLRRAVEHHFADPAQPRAVTISVGIAGLPEHGPTAETVVAAADAALYEAKRAGRNRVVLAAPPAVSEAPARPSIVR